MNTPHKAPAEAAPSNDPSSVFWGDWFKPVLPYDIDSLENVDETFLDRVVGLTYPHLKRYFDFQVQGCERISEGAGLYVGNHSGGIVTPDSFLFGAAVYEQRGIEHTPYALTHEAVLQTPVLHHVLTKLGSIRASHENSHRIFEAGKKVLVYPGGDVDVYRPYRHRNKIVFNGRMGYVRLALTAGVPIIPVVTAGSHETLMVLEDMKWLAKLLQADKWMRMKVWPLMLSVPWGLTLGPTPPNIPLPVPIHMEVLEPIHFSETGPEAAANAAYVRNCANRVEAAMQEALTALAQRREATRKRRRLRPKRRVATAA